MRDSDRIHTLPPRWLEMLVIGASLGCIILMAWMTLNPPAGAGSRIAQRTVSQCIMDLEGYMRGELFGQIKRKLNWAGKTMRCDGMFRPEGNGIRLVFDEHLNEDQPGLLIVIGIADAVIGQSADELPVNITIIDQEQGLFFATPDEPRCWTTFDEQLLLTGTVEEMWRINGHLYCASPLPAVTGNASVTLSELEYSGIFKPAAE